MVPAKYIHATSSPDGSEGLLAVVVKAGTGEHSRGARFFTTDNQSLQCGVIRRPEGHVVPPHVHPGRIRTVHSTQEVLVVLAGRAKLTVYDSAGGYVTDETIVAGDLVVLVSGGHGLVCETDFTFVEVKQGPYNAEFDKIRLLPSSPNQG
ncbi:MAG: hypothetical protein ACRC7O_06275 [Fimbriiglobus sp.]